MKHWHVVMLRVTGDGAGGSYFAVRQVDIDYATPEAAAEVLAGLYEQQLGQKFSADYRRQVVQLYADNPKMSTEPMTPSDSDDFLAVVPCEASGEACIETGNAWGSEKIAMRKALGIW